HCFFYLLTRPPPSSTLFPYTTLFRSIRLPRQRSATGRIHRPNYPRRGEIRFGDGEGAVARDEGPTASARFRAGRPHARGLPGKRDRKSTRLNSSHDQISYAVFCLKKK